jgi:hypothetical protein
MKNKNTLEEVNEYYETVTKAAKTLEEYYERMANFTSDLDRSKEYNKLRVEMKDLWKTHASYAQAQ